MNDQPVHLHLPEAASSWKLIMQSGVGLELTVGVPLSDLLTDGLGLNPEQESRIEALLLDGLPVDDTGAAIVGDNSRLALAAGLPGIAGLAMKRDSGVKVLRATITYLKTEEAAPRPGRLTLALYSLVLPALGGHFLRRGVLVRLDQLRRYARFAPDDLVVAGEKTISINDFLLTQAEAGPETEFFLSADLKDEPAQTAPGCRDCPVACGRPDGRKEKRDQQAQYAALWSLDPAAEDFTDFIAEYHIRCDDLGLNAFDVAGALSLAQRAGLIPAGDRQALLSLLEEAGQGTELGRAVGGGLAAAERAWGVRLPEGLEMKKKGSSADPRAAFLDSAGLCGFASRAAPESPEALAALAEVLTAKYGRPFSAEELSDLGGRIVEMEAAFDRAAKGH